MKELEGWGGRGMSVFQPFSAPTRARLQLSAQSAFHGGEPLFVAESKELTSCGCQQGKV